jgi:kumamolisin
VPFAAGMEIWAYRHKEEVVTTGKSMVNLAGSERHAVSGARMIGPADGSERLEVTMVVRHRSEPLELARTVASCSGKPAGRQYMTREEFAKTYGANPDDFAKIRSFAKEYELAVVSESAARRSVVLAGTVQAFGKAFAVELHQYSHPGGGTFRGRTGFVRIPAELEGIVEGVFGLDNRPQARTHYRRLAKAGAEEGGYSPTQVAQAYDFPAGLDGTGQCLAILELGGGYEASDLTSFFGNLNIATPVVTDVSVDGATNVPGQDPNGADGEVELDIEVAGTMAPKAEIAVYFAPNTDQGFLDGVTTAIHDANLKPSVLSISWGGPESSWTQQAMQSLDSACQDAAVLGVTILVASGDNGATDGVSNGDLTVDFPSSSPNVTGCGGTTLDLSASNTITSEVAWNELAENEGATGGGVSQVFPLPAWQQNANVPKAPNGSAGRGVPDVAGDADPTTGYNVLVDGQAAVIGGTSAVAPMWAGLLILLNQSLGKPVGFLNATLYTIGSVAGALHDITQGNNAGYDAGPGWDACTGLGSPNGTKLLAALKAEGGA